MQLLSPVASRPLEHSTRDGADLTSRLFIRLSPSHSNAHFDVRVTGIGLLQANWTAPALQTVKELEGQLTCIRTALALHEQVESLSAQASSLGAPPTAAPSTSSKLSKQQSTSHPPPPPQQNQQQQHQNILQNLETRLPMLLDALRDALQDFQESPFASATAMARRQELSALLSTRVSEPALALLTHVRHLFAPAPVAVSVSVSTAAESTTAPVSSASASASASAAGASATQETCSCSCEEIGSSIQAIGDALKLLRRQVLLIAIALITNYVTLLHPYTTETAARCVAPRCFCVWICVQQANL